VLWVCHDLLLVLVVDALGNCLSLFSLGHLFSDESIMVEAALVDSLASGPYGSESSYDSDSSESSYDFDSSESSGVETYKNKKKTKKKTTKKKTKKTKKKALVSSPKKAPKKAPAVSPKKAPAVAPKKAPAVAPKKAPAVAPKKAPAVAPKKTPAVAPKKAPAVAPKKAPAVAPAASVASVALVKPVIIQSTVLATTAALIPQPASAPVNLPPPGPDGVMDHFEKERGFALAREEGRYCVLWWGPNAPAEFSSDRKNAREFVEQVDAWRLRLIGELGFGTEKTAEEQNQ
jgi:cell wall-associated NlpC family hydrolase